MTADLVAFLHARLDEREAVARAALARVRRWPATQLPPWQVARRRVEQLGQRTAALDAFEGRETPAEVLADVAAKRALLDAMTGPALSVTVAGTQDAGLAVARHLAVAYADHDEYREEWKP